MCVCTVILKKKTVCAILRTWCEVFPLQNLGHQNVYVSLRTFDLIFKVLLNLSRLTPSSSLSKAALFFLPLRTSQFHIIVSFLICPGHSCYFLSLPFSYVDFPLQANICGGKIRILCPSVLVSLSSDFSFLLAWCHLLNELGKWAPSLEKWTN